MVAYAAVHGDYLFYNGNGFGATGIGLARRARPFNQGRQGGDHADQG
jgi:hypothetical protein